MFNYEVRKNWHLDKNAEQWWNNVCIWVIENYGLPGDNYVTELSNQHMIFKFKQKEHAMLTALRWGNDNGR